MIKENKPMNPIPLPTKPDRLSTITIDILCCWTVKLTYFKPSGKYYANGKYTSYKKDLDEIWEEVEQLLDSGTRPGLVNGHNEFCVLVEVPCHPHNHPRLIPPSLSTMFHSVATKTYKRLIADNPEV